MLTNMQIKIFAIVYDDKNNIMISSDTDVTIEFKIKKN